MWLKNILYHIELWFFLIDCNMKTSLVLLGIFQQESFMLHFKGHPEHVSAKQTKSGILIGDLNDRYYLSEC